MFKTKTDLISYEVKPALGEYFNDFDIDAIIDEVYEFDAPEDIKTADGDWYLLANSEDADIVIFTY